MRGPLVSIGNEAEVAAMPRNKQWTRDDDRRLAELRAAGKSSVSIAAALKRTARAVDQRISILRKRTAEDAKAPRPEAAGERSNR